MKAVVFYSIDSCKLHTMYEVKVKALATGKKQTNSFSHMRIALAFGYVADSFRAETYSNTVLVTRNLPPLSGHFMCNITIFGQKF